MRLLHPVFCAPLPILKASLLLCKHTTSGGNHQPQSWNNHSRAEHVTNPHSFSSLPPDLQAWGNYGADFGLKAMCHPQDKRKERCYHTPYCLLFLHYSHVMKQWRTFWMFLTSAKIHRSVVQHWCCVLHIMWNMQAFVYTVDIIESPGWGMEAREGGRVKEQHDCRLTKR